MFSEKLSYYFEMTEADIQMDFNISQKRKDARGLWTRKERIPLHIL